MGIPARPSGESLARGTYNLSSAEINEVIGLVMDAQSQLMSAQQRLNGVAFTPAWDGFTERRRETRLRHASYARRGSDS